MMKYILSLSAIVLAMLLMAGCGDDIANPFTGSQWDVADNHISFSHAVAEWDTADNKLVLKFDLLSGSSYPTATVTVEKVTTLAINSPREVTVKISISNGVTYESKPTDTDAQATITFTQLDLTTFGAASGTITGMAQRTENLSEAPVELSADFNGVPITN
jgi:hypothetical protein